MSYVITTDTASDLPESYFSENNIPFAPLYYTIDDVMYGDEKKLDTKEFFDAMRSGKMPTTMAANPEKLAECFRKVLESGNDILHIAFSSGLSGSYQSACIAKDDLSEEFPDKKIIVIDTLAASLGEGLLVHLALKKQKEGLSLEENAKYIEETKNHLTHVFTVNDLFHLHRGGRVSKATAIIGTMISVKPVLRVDEEGHLVPLMNVRGRKKSLNTLCELFIEKTKGNLPDTFFISHGDCEKDAEYVRDLITEKTGIKDCLISPLTPTIGAHAGPGTVALFFVGNEK